MWERSQPGPDLIAVNLDIFILVLGLADKPPFFICCERFDFFVDSFSFKNLSVSTLVKPKLNLEITKSGGRCLDGTIFYQCRGLSLLILLSGVFCTGINLACSSVSEAKHCKSVIRSLCLQGWNSKIIFLLFYFLRNLLCRPPQTLRLCMKYCSDCPFLGQR